MNCLDFRRLCLSEPNSSDKSYVKHGNECPECSDYAKGVCVLDDNIRASLDTAIPDEFKAKLKLRQTIESEAQGRKNRARYAIAASFIVAMVVGAFMFQQRASVQEQDYNDLLAGIVSHMQHSAEPLPPESVDLQKAIQLQLASYDKGITVGKIHGLRLANICPMGKYRGLHAEVDTDQGVVSFAYIKGKKLQVSDLMEYGGYYSKVIPMGNGNLIIVSENKQAMPDVESNLVTALKWDI